LVKRVLHIFYLILFPCVLFGQNLDRQYVIDQNRIAIDLNREGKFSKADQILNDLLQRLNSEHSEDKFFELTYQTKAKVVQSLGNYRESNRLARQALGIAMKYHDSLNIADSYNTIGVNHYFESDYDSTTYYYTKSFEIKKQMKTDSYALAVSAYNLALVYEDLGQSQKALENYEQAESLLLESSNTKNFLSDVYVGMALIHFYSGDISKSEIYVEKAMEKGLMSYGEFNPNMTFVYTTYANILEEEKKYEEAVSMLEKNLKIRLSTYGPWHRWTCETYYDLANSYVLVKNYDKAESYYQKAIEIGLKINSRQYLANARNFLAQLYIDRGIHLDKARDLLELSLRTNIDIYGDQNDLVAENYLQLARVFKLKKDVPRFMENIHKSLRASNYRQNDLSSVIGPLQALNSMMLLSEWFVETYKRDGDTSKLLDAYRYVDQKTALIKHTQSNFSSERSRINFANQYREVFEMDLGLCWLLYYETYDPKYLQKAFELSETNRNTTLLEGLQEIKYRAYGEIPQEKLELEQSTKKALEKVKMDIFYEKTANDPDKKFYQSLLDERIVLSNRLDSIYKVFNKNYPKFNSIDSGNEIITIEEVQHQLDEDTQVLTYFLGDQSLFTFNIERDTITLLRADIAGKLEEITNDFKNHLSKHEDIKELSYDLYMYLLGQQLDPDKENVVVVADNVLNYIPFEALRTPDGSYLVEHYNVSYNGSVRLFMELGSDFFKYAPTEKWAGFAPVYEEGEELTSTVSEIDEIADLTDGIKFIGEDATKENFFVHNKNFSVLHFAMHAKIDNENPLYNRLLFEDGELTASEIYTSTSNSNMAVLSACNTGFGKIEKGEGVMSMARAFHFSGIPSVVMSLWKVPDKETKTIMIDFYKYLRRGKTKSEAMRLAKRKYLEKDIDIELKHPYYWAGFVINGNTDPIDLNNGISFWLYVLMGLGLVLLAGYLLRKYRAHFK